MALSMAIASRVSDLDLIPCRRRHSVTLPKLSASRKDAIACLAAGAVRANSRFGSLVRRPPGACAISTPRQATAEAWCIAPMAATV
jgi:hypothetical protein